METCEAVLAVTTLTDGKATRTVIQKLCYFLKVNGLVDVVFRSHFYGPYSDDVAEALSFLVGIGLVDEAAERYENSPPSRGWRKYTYKITDEGKTIVEEKRKSLEYDKTREIVEKCEKFSGFDLDILAAATKIDYILRKKGEDMQESHILEEDMKNHLFSWVKGVSAQAQSFLDS